MSDRYQNFAELKAGCRAGLDYNISMEDRGGRVLVFSPHACGIEPGTSELVRAIAGADLSYYLFEGIRSGNNSELHITSHHFDEPRCVGLIEKFEISLALHGYNKFEPMIYLGGKNERLKEKLKEALTGSFPLQDKNEVGLDGLDPMNICNRTASGSGAQLEFSTGFRRELFGNLEHESGRRVKSPDFLELVALIRRAIADD